MVETTTVPPEPIDSVPMLPWVIALSTVTRSACSRPPFWTATCAPSNVPPPVTISVPLLTPPISTVPKPDSTPPFTSAVLLDWICNVFAPAPLTVPRLLMVSSASVPIRPSVNSPLSFSTAATVPLPTVIVPPPLSATPVTSTAPPPPTVSLPVLAPTASDSTRAPPSNVPPFSTETVPCAAAPPWPTTISLVPALTTPMLLPPPFISSEPEPLRPTTRLPPVTTHVPPLTVAAAWPVPVALMSTPPN